ncbi:winged helix-turn-helix transcriptional regulator [Chelatococcus asaccharovorans]|uniref:winged helix-turn-helix transcriptional regulator n=1 Tax=Chelatococcus asaccharovorans TaxID=28210 RepID=UPI00224C6E1F|nr:helix-turn-helix domain-containing protein [Chelatococcus asaccharovorans]CAH1657791.1 Transcriptional regulator, MarR family; Cinnamoyl ester hydrolase [Chelatococcus asaccharovorans]CAH1687450.1 Transcriptional regulator, MarR family; Cinnamoyl ester hydrolase [Chelatococcus asaccharovorans]
MAKARHSRFDCSPGCSVEAAIGLIDGKWKSVVLYHLLSGTLRFNEIRRHLTNVTPRMLTNQLRELEGDGLVERKVYAQVPPKVEYSLSPLGRSMEPILLALKAWGDSNIGLYGKSRGIDPRDEASRPVVPDAAADFA